MEKSDERNVAISKDMKRLGFPKGFWPAGILPKQKPKFRASPWEAMDGIPEI